MIKKIKENILSNKYLYLILGLFLITSIYASLNTLIVNDDLGYSFLYRTSTRITNMLEVLKMQISDYKIVSSRVFVHMVVQALLIYGKNLWSILNPIVIILNFYFINKIVRLYIKGNNKIFNYILGLMCFMALVTYKWMIYWVAGSVNYIWTSSLLFGFIYLYLKYDFHKNILVNMFLLLIISILHESTFVFSVIFVVFSLGYEYLFKKIFDKKNLLLFIPLIISAVFLFLGPGTLSRMNSYSNLSLIEKFKLSLPVVSFNIYNIKNINNMIPILFLGLSLIKLFRCNNKIKYVFILSIFVSIFFILYFNNNWFYFVLSVLVLLSTIYINYEDYRNKLSIIFISYYAVCYSLCLTIEYVSGRPNYFIFIYMIFLIILYMYDILSIKFIGKLTFIFFIIFLFLMTNEIYIYNYIGSIKKDRLIAIQKYINKETDKLYYKKIEDKYYLYQMDMNEPTNEDYYAYKYFLDYYNLPYDTVIEFVE